MLETRDADAVLAIQSACPNIAQWSRDDYMLVAAGDMAGWVAESLRGMEGFVVARRVVSDIEILNLAVMPETRRKGAGSALLAEAMAWGELCAARHAHLEVRASNAAAVRFYQHHGFEIIGRRPRYYTAPPEDALLLTATIR